MAANREIKYLTDIGQLERLSEAERAGLGGVCEKFAFRSNDYYLSLIDWDNPDDPIRQIVIPHVRELDQWGRLDPSDESRYTVMPGVEHKYPSTVLLMVSNVCDGICRYCFRKRIFIRGNLEYLRDLPAAAGYIEKHTEITNVLLTGGDPLSLSTNRLEDIVRRLRRIEHVRIIRIGTKVPAFNPYRVLYDRELPAVIEKYSTAEKKIYIMTHFVHPRELTEPAVQSVHLLQTAGAVVANQMPLVRSLNDDASTLAELLSRLSFIGAVPYYIFQCRPALGNRAYTVPVEEGYELVERAKAAVSGLAKRVRYVMSHSTGKVETIGKSAPYVYFKYHRAAEAVDSGRFFAFRSNPNAFWFDDYEEVKQKYPAHLPYRTHGPQ